MSTHRVFQSVPNSAVAEPPSLLEDGASFTYLRMAQKKVRFKMSSVCSMQRKKRPRQPSRSPPPSIQRKKRPRQPSRSLLHDLQMLSVRVAVAPVYREKDSAVAADRRTRARVAADEWCSLVQLVKTLPMDILVIVVESFAFPSSCYTWLDPNHYQDISAQVARWHSDNTVCPTSFAFHCNPTCPGWTLCAYDYAQFCRWKGRCITPRIIALQ